MKEKRSCWKLKPNVKEEIYQELNLYSKYLLQPFSDCQVTYKPIYIHTHIQTNLLYFLSTIHNSHAISLSLFLPLFGGFYSSLVFVMNYWISVQFKIISAFDRLWVATFWLFLDLPFKLLRKELWLFLLLSCPFERF